MSGNDPLPTGTPIGDWGFCDHAGCAGRVPIERESLLCDEHWEAVIRSDLRAKVEALPHTNKCDTQDPVYAGRGKTMRCTCWQAEVLALIDGGSDGAT